MVFSESRLAGAWGIDVSPIHDDRGLFAVTWLADEFEQRGLDASLAQCNLAWNRRRGTLRGLHFQRAPFEQVKIVKCTRGALCDVIVDLRPASPTYRQWDHVELTAENRRMLYVPAGFAHGYLTLTGDAEVYYHASRGWTPSAESGVRWNDPAFAIEWPFEPQVISDKDRTWPLLA